jgi:hypothetical protein
MRAALIAMMILLLPAALLANPTMGVYFTYTGNQMHYNPTPYEQFYGYIYAQGTECYLNAAEYLLQIPAGVVVMGWTLPAGALELGSPLGGHSVAYWPPMDGWNPGANLLCTVKFMAIDWCYTYGGTMHDAPIRIAPHPDTGLIQYSCWPENNLFEYTGLTSILCPEVYGVQETNWGAIKSLF